MQRLPGDVVGMANLIRVKMSRGGRPLIVRFHVIQDDVRHTYKHRAIRFENELGYVTERADAQSEPRRVSGSRKLMIKDPSTLEDFLTDYARFRKSDFISYEMIE